MSDVFKDLQPMLDMVKDVKPPRGLLLSSEFHEEILKQQGKLIPLPTSFDNMLRIWGFPFKVTTELEPGFRAQDDNECYKFVDLDSDEWANA